MKTKIENEKLNRRLIVFSSIAEVLFSFLTILFILLKEQLFLIVITLSCSILVFDVMAIIRRNIFKDGVENSEKIFRLFYIIRKTITTVSFILAAFYFNNWFLYIVMGILILETILFTGFSDSELCKKEPDINEIIQEEVYGAIIVKNEQEDTENEDNKNE